MSDLQANEIIDLRGLRVRTAERTEIERCQEHLATHHELGRLEAVGERLWQVVEDRQRRVVAVLAFTAAAKRLKDREEWIGWDPRTRAERLKLVVNQARFCLLHRQPNLASRVLSLSEQALPQAWCRHYGYQPLLLETFVDPQAHLGTCYRAANWIELGRSQGHRRCAGPDYYQAHGKPKMIWIRPLRPEASTLLRGPADALPQDCRPALPVAAMGQLPLSLSQVESLFEAFARVPDPRHRNRRHRLPTVLTIVAMGILMGLHRPADFLRLAQQLGARQREALRYWLPPGRRTRQAPGKDAFYELLDRLDPHLFAAALTAWLGAHHGQLPRALALDGKTVSDRCAQVISLVDQRGGATVALAPILCANKESEVPAARQLLARLDLQGSLVSLDAGHANRATAATIIDQDGEYLLQLKGNVPNVRAAAQARLASAPPLFVSTNPAVASSAP